MRHMSAAAVLCVCLWRQVESCKKRMNTFGFVGDLSKDPEVSCVYHSEEAENQVRCSNAQQDTSHACGSACTVLILASSRTASQDKELFSRDLH